MVASRVGACRPLLGRRGLAPGGSVRAPRGLARQKGDTYEGCCDTRSSSKALTEQRGWTGKPLAGTLPAGKLSPRFWGVRIGSPAARERVLPVVAARRAVHFMNRDADSGGVVVQLERVVEVVYEASDGGVSAFSAPACERAPLPRRPLGGQRCLVGG
jgi:hypothetical protein